MAKVSIEKPLREMATWWVAGEGREEEGERGRGRLMEGGKGEEEGKKRRIEGGINKGVGEEREVKGGRNGGGK